MSEVKITLCLKMIVEDIVANCELRAPFCTLDGFQNSWLFQRSVYIPMLTKRASSVKFLQRDYLGCLLYSITIDYQVGGILSFMLT